ncbi:sensor histidine kinase [Flexithrix dorotheae]|uniref:sensor histidine kinase n=1 Tax=Flexithrix dorotheae TaxID=70993 RepID=UPI00036EA3B1|nr:HAMP domain-containing sensor histidine kinase [Flexithrix dorotheae]
MKKDRVYIFLALISLGLTLSLHFFYGSINTEKLFSKSLSHKLAQESKIADDNIFEFKQRFTEGSQISFNNLFSESKYPIFVYKNKNLLYWSDHKYDIQYQYFAGYYKEKCIDTGHAIYLVKKSIDKINEIEFEIITLIPLKSTYDIESKYLRSEYNPEIFPNQDMEITLEKQSSDEDIFNAYGTYLFSISFPPDFYYEGDNQLVTLFFGISFCLFLFLFFKIKLYQLIKKGRVWLAFVILIFMVVSFRGLMIYYRIPHDMMDIDLFKANIFASSIISPSLGDLLLNLFGITLIIGFIARNLGKLIPLKQLLKLDQFWKDLLSVVLVTITYFSGFYIYAVLQTIYFNSSITLDITSEINFFLPVKIICIVIFILCALNYFIICHVSSKILIKLGKSLYGITVVFVLGSLIYYILSVIMKVDNILIFNVNAIYFATITYFNFPLFLRHVNYSTLVYFIFCIVASSIIGAYAIFNFEQIRDLENKNRYANILTFENDPYGEFNLNQIVQEVRNDTTIKSWFIDEFYPDLIKNKIKRSYITKYFDKYDLEIRLFDGDGTPYDSDANYNALRRMYSQDKYKTEYSNVYFVNELATGNNKYSCLISLDTNSIRVGHIVLDFVLKKSIPNSIYPPFLDKRFEDLNRYEDYSYSIYLDDRLMYSYGDYNYDNKFLSLFEHEKGYLKKEIETEKYSHFRVPGKKNKNIIISSLKYPPRNVLSNFSFFFLILVLALIMVIFYQNYISGRRKGKMNFTTRIQVYLVFAFFLPLAIVSVIIVSILSTGNQSETESFYLEKAQNVSNNVGDEIIDYNRGLIDKDRLADKIVEISRFTQSDINLYDPSGRLLVTSLGVIFDNHLLTNLVNPRAYVNILEKNQAKTMLDEKVGDLNFNAAYVGIKSPDDSGEILGIISIPFFESKDKLENQIIDVISTIMQIFTSIFVVLLALSYFSVKSLTRPLVLITQKIKKVSLTGKNEELEYQSDDEIGLLVGEYNKMILKLDDSRAALARSEKETAWREMAKQVAHEIKNPLTPMKLSLQQLERVLNGEERARKSIKMLLGQVDTLNDITTSFSTFAKMPLPQEEKFELGAILKQTIELHGNNTKSKIIKRIPEGEFYVNADKKLMGRVFTNLILNGIQAVPSGLTPEIQISLKPFSPHKILLEFKDNGEGIPEYIQGKIFIPNFTTKATGSGIGLAIAKRGIEHSGGSIWFETEPGNGTTFFIEMPLCSN